MADPGGPAPTAIITSDAKASTGCTFGWTTTMPTSAVNTTRNITRGLSRATKSDTSPFDTPSEPISLSACRASAAGVVSVVMISTLRFGSSRRTRLATSARPLDPLPLASLGRG